MPSGGRRLKHTQVPYADAMSKTLVFAIYDFDRFSKHDQIGEVKVPLCQVDLAQTIEEWAEVTSVEGEGGQVPLCRFITLLTLCSIDIYIDIYHYMRSLLASCAVRSSPVDEVT